MTSRFVQIWAELTWAPTWINVSEEQFEILARAANAIREMSIALDKIDHEGTHVCNDDLQLESDTIVRSKEAEIAHGILYLAKR